MFGAGIDAEFETRFTWATLPVVSPAPPTSEMVTAIPATESVSVVPRSVIVVTTGYESGVLVGVRPAHLKLGDLKLADAVGCDRARDRRRAVAPVDRRDEILGLRPADRRRRTWWSKK